MNNIVVKLYVKSFVDAKTQVRRRQYRFDFFRTGEEKHFARYTSKYNVSTADAILEAIRYIISIAIESDMKDVNITIDTKRVKVTDEVKQLLATWYECDDVINSINFGKVTGEDTGEA